MLEVVDEDRFVVELDKRDNGDEFVVWFEDVYEFGEDMDENVD